MIHLEDIDENNWRTPLVVAKEQERYVANQTVMLARAYAYRNLRSRAFLICDDDEPVGMGLYYDCPDLNAYDFSQIFIDKSFQGKGYGRIAIGLILDCMRTERRYNKVVLCYIEGNEAARKLYESFGFVETGRDEDEIIMELELCEITNERNTNEEADRKHCKYYEWDEESFVLSNEYCLGEKADLADALNVFYQAGGYEFFNVVNPEYYASNWLEFIGGLYSAIMEDKYVSYGKQFIVPLNDAQKQELASRNVPERFIKDIR